MNKKYKICFFIGFFIVAVVFAFHSAGYRSSYITNYSKNFKTNLYIITQKLSLPEQVTAAVPTPNIDEIINTPAPTLTPAPIFDPQKRNKIHAINKSVMIPVQNSANMEFVVCGEYLVGADKTQISFFTKRGDIEATSPVQLSEPLIAVSDKYVVAADKGGNKLYLFEGTKLLFERDIDEKIICADVSGNGDIVLVCDKKGYKGCVNVYNKKGENIYTWNSGSDRIIDASISGKTRDVAVLLMNLDNATVSSNVLWCDISSDKTKTAAQYSDTLMYDIEFSDNDLFVVGADKLALVSGGKADWEQPYSDGDVQLYSCRKMFVGAFDIDNLPYIEAYSENGRKKGSIKLNAHPDHIDFADNVIAYNEGRTLVVSDVAAKKSKSFSCMRDIKDIVIINSSLVAVVYSSSIEFVNVK